MSLPYSELPLFCFGTLMDTDVLAHVLGDDHPIVEVQPARVLGRVQRCVVGQNYPVLITQEQGTVQGVLISGLNSSGFERIVFFEGDEYVLDSLDVEVDDRSIRACYFRDTGVDEVTDQEWQFDRWLKNEKAAFVERTRNYMTWFGKLSRTEADRYW